jgi:hypothetical protein
LGHKWDTAGQIFTFFGPGIGIMLIYATHGLIHLSIGRADRWFRWVIVEFSVTASLFLIGLRWGPVGVAAAWSASFWILTLPAFWYAGRPIQFGVKPIVSTIWRYVVASLIAGGASALVIREVPWLFSSPSALFALVRILIISVLFSALYVVAVILLHGGPEPLYRFARLLPDLVPSRFSTSSSRLQAKELASQNLRSGSSPVSERPTLWPEEVN